MKTVTVIALVVLWAAIAHAIRFDNLFGIQHESEKDDLTVRSFDRPVDITPASNRIRTACSPKVLVYGYDEQATHQAVVAHLTSSGVIQASDISLIPVPFPLSSADVVGIDIVFVWNPTSGLYDPDGTGDVLADFVDGGGAVVLFSVMTSNTQFTPQGRFVTENYMPFQLGPTMAGTKPGFTFAAALDAPNVNHPLLAGIVQGGQALYNPGQTSQAFIGDNQIAPGATLVASYADVSTQHYASVPAIAVTTLPGKKPVVALQFYPFDDFDYLAITGGQAGLSVDSAAQERLMLNAVLYSWTSNCQTEQPCTCNNAIKNRLCSLPAFAHLCA
eukprot:TRINITY_DN263_c0_g1_i3.p1 TRINITY_DN263_c0_g1~~TRINITY_DN263_c0_g1_i3.p1  ORF type:complete len:331 (-),score=71.85 TRINITY_DN263_c0_g1_i3:207-1199(-)